MSTTSYTASAEKLTDNWFGSINNFADNVPSAGLMPSIDFKKALDRYFLYLLDGLRVNQKFMTDLASSVPIIPGGGGPGQAMVDATIGHAKAISTWIADEMKMAHPAF